MLDLHSSPADSKQYVVEVHQQEIGSQMLFGKRN
jgi:hypothetical protein